MTSPISGLHHVTAIASDPQANLDFYSGLLGLRLVKKTVNFDDPSAYHLYYGDESGTPGSIVTFFYWPGGAASAGRVGSGQVTRLSFSMPAGSLDFWAERLRRHGVDASRETRFGEEVLAFADPDGIPVELVRVAEDPRPGWSGGTVPGLHALRGMHTTELTVREATATEGLLTGLMGFRLVRREGRRARFESGRGGSGTYADVLASPSASLGSGGVGTVHHIAWRVPDDAAEADLQSRLARGGFGVSPVRDRTYFRSIYYREHGGILFEIATDIPGFAIDESAATLGQELRLPPQFESSRSEIEALLPPLHRAREFA